MQNLVASWIVFFVLGGITGYLRYGDALSPQHLGILRDYGIWVVMITYVMVVLAAYKDSVFQGILSTLIPFYGFYWLFMVTDAFMIRAVVAGLLVGLGQDYCIWFNDIAQDTIQKVHAWISSGG
ncbi:MAG: small basic protein [Candidatus Promineifilaceae bacterium]|jgi:small basic protein